MPPHEVQVRVRYAETDRMGLVYYGNYFTYFEVGRTDLLRGFISARTKRKFSAFLVRGGDGKVGFEFEPRKPKTGAKTSAEETAKTPAKVTKTTIAKSTAKAPAKKKASKKS